MSEGLALTEVTVEAESSSSEFWGHTVSDLQSDVEVSDHAITGTLAYVDSGALATDWGAGNFIALKFSNPDSRATDVKVGLEPSQGSGLVSLDEDMNGVFKITSPSQRFIVVQTVNGENYYTAYDLSGLTLESE